VTADAEATAVVARLRSRFRGALLGLALGDALAAPAQYARAGTFGPVRDLLGGGPYDLPRGAWTDDTALALLLARSLLECRDCDPADQRQRFRRWQLDGEGSATGECLGITASVSRALTDGTPAKEIADGADALVRLAPLVMWHYADADALAQDLEPMARVTCHDAETITAVAAFARLLQQALRGVPLPELLPSASLPPASPVRESSPSQRHGASPRILAESLEAMRGARNWKDAVLRAINAGGDADARGATTGQLAGAVFGVESIPDAWLLALTGRDAIEELADGILVEVLVSLGERE
jgi:ADP-ribosyl-[dinitrogen reductase] hydrolase